MGRILRGILSFVVLGALLWGSWFGWESWRLDKARSALTEVVQSTDLDALLRGEEPDASKSSDIIPDDIAGAIIDNIMGEGGKTPELAGVQAGATTLMKASPSELESAPHAGTEGERLESQPGTEAGTNSATGNPVDLALRNILLSQGEQGIELWRLQANWATLRQESGLVEVRDPNVRYALGDPQGERDGKPYFDDDQFVTVTSRTGRVTDNNSRITLEGNVRSEYQGDVLVGPLAEFSNDSRVLLYPQGATLEGLRLNGFAHVLRWNMATNTLEGEQGVTLVWTPENAAAVKSAPNLEPALPPPPFVVSPVPAS